MSSAPPVEARFVGKEADSIVPEDKLGVGGGSYGRITSNQTRILVLYTGGTMGMKPDQNGLLAPVPGYLTGQIETMLKLYQHDPLPTVVVKEYQNLIDSCDMGPPEWKAIAVDLKQQYHSFEGFVVITGTDTMAYSSSALSFMLENLGKTVIFTGSQIPFCKTFSDARRNLLFSISLAATMDIPEVCIFFDDKLMRANRCRKADSASFHAFVSPNIPPLATLGLGVQVNHSMILDPPKGRLRIATAMDSKVVVVKLTPTFDYDALMAMVENYKGLRAVCLELFGSGTAPRNQKAFIEVLELCKQKNVVVVATSQCATGPVLPTTYAVSKYLENSGVVLAGDMTTEATCAKLAYLFGKGLAPKQICSVIQTSLRGEITTTPPRLPPNVRSRLARL
mmetsp:Transcript_37366/g.87924  ORF Transcript_37366/g.87924 Transcript_37366/m.87924 type:complete len:394 (+) Transcript_37366:103-1284(+)